MIYCDNDSCVWCKRDHRGDLRCTGIPVILKSCGSLIDHNVICGSYIEKDGSQKMEEVWPGRDSDGYFPGQYRRPK